MIPGSYSEVYSKCGKQSCRCNDGIGHLFKRITWSDNGRCRTKGIPDQDIQWIKEVTEHYRGFKRKRREMKQLEDRLRKLVDGYVKEMVDKTRKQKEYL